MASIRPWLLVGLVLLAGSSARGAEIAVATLVDGDARLLRATTCHKLVPGARLEDGDIVAAGDRAQVHLEFTAGSLVNLVGAGTLYLVPPPAKPKSPAGAPSLVVPSGWIKVAAKAPGVQVRVASAEVAIAAGAVVMRTDGTTLNIFIESGSARITELAPSGAGQAARDAKHDEYWSRSATGAFVPSTRPPRAFVEAMPRHFVDALPSFAGKFKTRPALVADREITYAEAEPWLAGRDRAVFERRFASRLRDPVFRRAVEPDVARYPTWDRRLHPEKYAPPPVPKPPPSP